MAGESDTKAETIRVLEGLEPVRVRPRMYIGEVDSRGLAHLVHEVVDQSLDVHLARRSRRVRVEVSDDGWIEVEDDGPGIPTGRSRGGRTLLEHLLTTLHSGPAFGRYYTFSHHGVGHQGPGLAVVNALSRRLEITSRYEGRLWRAAFERGSCVEPPADCGPTDASGTALRFLPDVAIFGDARLERAVVERRLRDLSWLAPLWEVRWCGTVLPGREGLGGMARELAAGARLASECIVEVHQLADDVIVDAAIGWAGSGGPRIRSFVNHQETRGGAHVDGLRAGLFDAAVGLGCIAGPAVVDELLERGLVAAIHVRMPFPSFEPQGVLRTSLAAFAVRRTVARVMEETIRRWPALREHLLRRLDC